MSIALLRSKQIKSTVLCSSTETVISLQKAVRLVRHDQPLINPCWLVPVIVLSFICPETASKRTQLIIFFRPKWPLVSWVFFLLFSKMGAIFASLQSCLHIFLPFKRIEWPFGDFSYLFLHLCMHPILSQGLFCIKISQEFFDSVTFYCCRFSS